MVQPFDGAADNVLDVPKTAAELFREHGDGAKLVAAGRLNEMIDQGDHHGRDFWACIVSAIRAIQEELGL